MYEYTLGKLHQRGVKLEDLALIVIDLQKKYHPNLTLEVALENIDAVLHKREVQHATITGIELDELAEKNLLSEPLLSILRRDEPLYGVDEILALSIVNIYGSIGFTNFGYLDKVKPGIIGYLDGKPNGTINTFLDDILCAIVASACSRMAHSKH
ncbi:phosphatidylglycerophosphatase A [Bacillus bombysepticus]|uniref:phosphatidylglycerophosphatase A family protein n=1 Tax=Bacillus bombysepticus TaxID=658666 RepID=UPI0030191040